MKNTFLGDSTESRSTCEAEARQGGAIAQLRCMVITAVFPPEFSFSASTSAAIAEGMTALGHAVTVLAPFPSKPAGALFPGYNRRLYSQRQMPQGYRLVHCFSMLAPKSRMLPRFFENFSFGLTAGIRLLLEKRPDVVYSNAWPLFATSLIMLAAKLRHIPVVVSVQDVYPESLVSQGRTVAETRMFRVLRWIDARVAQAAKAIIVISDRFREIYESTRLVPRLKLNVVHNWGDRDAIQIDPSASARFRRSKGIPPNAFLAVYAGNIGPASGAEGLVEGFARLRDQPNVYLLIAGAGSNLESCVARARALSLNRVIFHSPWNLEETEDVLGAADVLLLPTLGRQSLASVPSKLISYLLSGRPVVAMVLPDSETAYMISRADAGWILPPDDPDQLAASIRNMASLPARELQRRGEQGRVFAHKNLCRESNLPKVIAILEAAARQELSQCS